jgi:hypothetical protein
MSRLLFVLVLLATGLATYGSVTGSGLAALWLVPVGYLLARSRPAAMRVPAATASPSMPFGPLPDPTPFDDPQPRLMEPANGLRALAVILDRGHDLALPADALGCWVLPVRAARLAVVPNGPTGGRTYLGEVLCQHGLLAEPVAVEVVVAGSKLRAWVLSELGERLLVKGGAPSLPAGHLARP